MQLIDNAKSFLKFTSVQVAAATGLLAIAEQALPQLQAAMPPIVYAALSAAIVFARLVKQPKLGG